MMKQQTTKKLRQGTPTKQVVRRLDSDCSSDRGSNRSFDKKVNRSFDRKRNQSLSRNGSQKKYNEPVRKITTKRRSSVYDSDT